MPSNLVAGSLLEELAEEEGIEVVRDSYLRDTDSIVSGERACSRGTTLAPGSSAAISIFPGALRISREISR